MGFWRNQDLINLRLKQKYFPPKTMAKIFIQFLEIKFHKKTQRFSRTYTEYKEWSYWIEWQ